MSSHSCSRCSWLMLNSTTGHSPYPKENQRITKENDDKATKWGFDICRETTNFFQRRGTYGTLLDWRFVWPIEYNSSDGDCALLQIFMDLYRAKYTVERDDLAGHFILEGAVDAFEPDALKVNIRNNSGRFCGSKISLFTDDPYNEWLSTRPIQTQPDSEAAYALVKSWIQYCETNHVSAQHSAAPEIRSSPEHSSIGTCMSDPTYRPLRLLYIQRIAAEWNLSIISSRDIVSDISPYTALSYCWGQGQTFKMTGEGLTESGGAVSYDDLPATIQDACRVTFRLGYSYLWVDALCIIQDDDREVHREISHMKLIYGNAALTIAASRAVSCSEGFLGPRDSHKTLPLKLRAQGAGDQIGEVGMIHEENDRLGRQPLEDRAWAFQESLLSVRVLEYTDRATRFFCRTSCSVDQRDRYKVDGWLASSNVLRYDVIGFPDSFSTLGVAEIFWARIISNYSRRELSVPSDRSLAISGVAERMHQALASLQNPEKNVEYIAGHWTYQLPWSLGWFSRDECARPKTYQGPSWSWLAVSSQVDHPSTPETPLLKIIASDTRLKEQSAPYGAVIHASITAKAYTSLVTLVKVMNGYRSYVRISREIARKSANHVYYVDANCFFDTSDDTMKAGVIQHYLIKLTQTEYTKKALICRQHGFSEGKRILMRIGLCTIAPSENEGFKSWSEGWDQEIVQLI